MDLIGFIGVVLAIPLVACSVVLVDSIYVEEILEEDTSDAAVPARS
ncbi:uncharacterized protein Dvar_54610 [Desulfosarcina variabilis str. Montpellier]